jgi:predicted transcriptional regulator
LTEGELEIMREVWQLERATVREVHERLSSSKKVAYTTVMTTMGILADKGHLVRKKDGRAYVYEPAEARNEVISGMVGEFIERVFDGSTRPLLLSLVKDRRLSRADLEALREMIDEVDE